LRTQKFALQDGNLDRGQGNDGVNTNYHIAGSKISRYFIYIGHLNEDPKVNLVISLQNQGTQMIQLIANQVEMTTLLDFNTAKQVELLKNQMKLLTSCSQMKLLADHVNTAKAIAKAEMIAVQVNIAKAIAEAEMKLLADQVNTAKALRLR